jgi:hypothetical protein
MRTVRLPALVCYNLGNSHLYRLTHCRPAIAIFEHLCPESPGELYSNRNSHIDRAHMDLDKSTALHAATFGRVAGL